MKKLLILFFVILPIISFASYNGIENLTLEEKISKLAACKRIKQEGKLSELTLKDWSLCTELLSNDLISSYENDPLQYSNKPITKTVNKKTIKKQQKTEEKIQEKQQEKWSEEDLKTVAKCQAAEITNIGIPNEYIYLCNKAKREGVYANSNDVNVYVEKIKEYLYQQKQEELRKKLLNIIATVILNIILFVCLYLFIIKIMPKTNGKNIKIFVAYTAISIFILLAVGISISVLSQDSRFVEDTWAACGGVAFCILGFPWFAYISFIFIKYATYEIRKAWLKAAEDAKKER